jgi:pentatricopeptide repeat protein
VCSLADRSKWHVGNSLVDMYAKCGSIEDAWRVFNKMPSQNVVIWTAILGGCAMHGQTW